MGVEVCWKYKLHSSMLFRAVRLVDGYLATSAGAGLPKKRFQLLGVSAVLLASKAEGGSAADIDSRKMAYITDHTYTDEQVREMEQELLPVLRWAGIGWGPFEFLQHFAPFAALTGRYFHLAHLVLESALLLCEFSTSSPSLLASGACVLSIEIGHSHGEMGEVPTWPERSGEVYKRSEAAVKQCARSLRTVLASENNPARDGSKLTSLHRKFSAAEYGNSAALLSGLAKTVKTESVG